MENEKIEVGDVVRLNSDMGPDTLRMTAYAVYEDAGCVGCMWIFGSEVRRDTFPKETLTVIERRSETSST